MDEVYGSIVDRYGAEGSPDVLSVLQELLEDDETANGLGDDGDIWRSWRHSWRHRNVRQILICVQEADTVISRTIPSTLTYQEYEESSSAPLRRPKYAF